MKIRFIVIGCICLTSLFIIVFKNYHDNKIWYNFEYNLKQNHDIIKRVSKADYGPNFTLYLYLKEDDVDFKIVESIFESFLMELNNEEFLDYLLESTNGNMVFISVMCKYKNEDSDLLYKFSTERMAETRYEEWRVETSIEEEYLLKKYNLADYKYQ